MAGLLLGVSRPFFHFQWARLYLSVLCPIHHAYPKYVLRLLSASTAAQALLGGLGEGRCCAHCALVARGRGVVQW